MPVEPQSTSQQPRRKRWPLKDADELRESLLASYSEPGRHYHDTRHLTEVLEALKDLQRAGNEFDDVAVGLAAWYRRCVFTGDRDDDERSAVRAEDELFRRAAPSLVREVGRLIRETETLEPEPGDANAAALVDAVLAVLKSPRERYDEYARDVRAEYSHLSDKEFRHGRKIVVKGLLARERIYHSEHGCQEWEAAARANLERELATLRGGAVPLW